MVNLDFEDCSFSKTFHGYLSQTCHVHMILSQDIKFEKTRSMHVNDAHKTRPVCICIYSKKAKSREEGK